MTFIFIKQVDKKWVIILQILRSIYKYKINDLNSISGVALGSYIYNNVVNKSYTIMFIINATLLFLAILYSLIKLKWQTLPQQQVVMGINLLTDFFDKKHVIATIKTIIKTRPNHGKLHLLFLLIIMMLYVFQRDEKPMSFLYAQLKFKWDVNTYSNFRTFQSSTFVLGQFLRNLILMTIYDKY